MVGKLDLGLDDDVVDHFTRVLWRSFAYGDISEAAVRSGLVEDAVGSAGSAPNAAPSWAGISHACRGVITFWYGRSRQCLGRMHSLEHQLNAAITQETLSVA